MARILDWLRSWIPRIRSINTPVGGVSWVGRESPADHSVGSTDHSAGSTGAAADEAAEEWDDYEPGDPEAEILVAVSEADDQTACPSEIAEAVDESEIRAHHHLEVLAEHGFLQVLEDDAGQEYFRLSSLGRSYLVENNLVD